MTKKAKNTKAFKSGRKHPNINSSSSSSSSSSSPQPGQNLRTRLRNPVALVDATAITSEVTVMLDEPISVVNAETVDDRSHLPKKIRRRRDPLKVVLEGTIPVKILKLDAVAFVALSEIKDNQHTYLRIRDTPGYREHAAAQNENYRCQRFCGVGLCAQSKEGATVAVRAPSRGPKANKASKYCLECSYSNFPIFVPVCESCSEEHSRTGKFIKLND